MGCGGSRIKQGEFEPIKGLIRNLDDSFTNMATSVDNVHFCAKRFVDELQKRTRETGHTDTSVTHVETLCQRLMDLYGPAIKLLIAVEACFEKKNHMVKTVNTDLHSVKSEVERLCQTDIKRFNVRSLETYIRNTDYMEDSYDTQLYESGRKVMEDSVMLLTMPTNLKERVDELSQNVSRLDGVVQNVILEKTSKELRLTRSGETHLQIENVQEKEKTEELRLTNSQVNTELCNKIDELKSEIKNVQNRNDEANREKDNILVEMKERMASLERETKLVTEKAKENEEKMKSFEKLQQENYVMKTEIEELKRKKILQVQLYSQTRGSLLTEISDGLQALLKSKINSSSTEVEFIKCFQPNEIETDKPVLNICINTSRLGTDTLSALCGVTVSPSMALLVVHHKDKHALPNQSSDRVLTGTEFSSLGGIFDLAFLSEKGIYDCEMNDHTITDLINFISKRITDSTENN